MSDRNGSMDAFISSSAKGVFASLLATLVFGLAPSVTRAESDDFNDGNDTGWTHDSPLSAVGAGGVYTFPSGNTYRIQAPQSPNPGAFGPARAGSHLPTSYTTFSVSVDIVDWNDNIDQAIGILSRMSSIGGGTTNGYAFTYVPTLDRIDISRVVGEAPTILSTGTGINLDPNKDYRLVFQGNGTTLTGSVYDLADLSTPLKTTSIVDGTYSSGVNGLFVSDDTPAAASIGDATFDNYNASVPEPTLGAALLLAGLIVPAARRRRREL